MEPEPPEPRGLCRRREVAAARGRGVEASGSRSRPVRVPSAAASARFGSGSRPSSVRHMTPSPSLRGDAPMV
ncbi:hypothetical protein B296_00005645 [Ensete ventricosum]|uniref:Uncharacterized protein n=1 Tax=Ensete ventricosum TaxID=4639 RepID=A0A427AMX2_ENSVE|nr:hypothetical protein B296_00005645 [Ensete ventricosum]